MSEKKNKPPGVINRRIVAPIVEMLTQGVSPSRIGMTLAIGAVAGIFPILGVSSIACVGVAIWLRLNQALLQTVNWAVLPLQPFFVLVFVRIGESVVGAEPMDFSPYSLVAEFSDSPSAFMKKFGVTGLHAILGWLLTAPLALWASYIISKPIVGKIAEKEISDE